MTLQEFIALKPEHIRLGQWFVISFCKPVHCQWEAIIDKLWNSDGKKAEQLIAHHMEMWQWDTLPDIKEEEQ